MGGGFVLFPQTPRAADRAAPSLRWVLGIVLVVGIGALAALLLPTAADRPVALLAFGVSALLLGALGVLCLILLRRAETERRAVSAERRLARVSVEEQMMARRRAEQADAISRELVQLLGRQLRGPLASIRGFARQLAEPANTLTPERRGEFFSVIRSQSNRLIRVIEDLMLAARLAAGDNEPLSPLPVDVATLVTDVVAEVEIAPPHRLVVTTSPDLPRVRAHSGELRQALLALIENAIRFSPKGGVIEVSAHTGSNGVEISVRDEGMGVAEERRETMFDLLARGSDAGGELDPGGLGVGLFIVRGVAARSDGEVRYDAGPDHGSRFTIWLPPLLGEDGSFLLTPRAQSDTIDAP